ncbi:RHS repeat-associated core domain-containing protein [Chryseobacterium arthrosphaerae]|uniref:RHS repeat-associated core domain-containing protein n=1 Tax=Chryseobacterium arthrosphaerae TaxID=651561 RepID=UPI000F4EA036|nr:RHS repeat-associated core domain-containing protein [Chryseobacterium arthrosphaerae]
MFFYKGANGVAEIDRVTHYYPFGLEFNENIVSVNSITKNYRYSTQGQEKQEVTKWSSFKWRNYDPSFARFFNVDPLAEKYPTWSTYVFSGNRVVDARELEGLEPVDFRKNDGFKNLVVVAQGWSGDTKKGYTQAQNRGDGSVDKNGLGALNQLNSKNTRVVIFDSSRNENTKNDINATISSFNKNHPDGTVAAVGHSLGGDNLVEKVNENKDLKVDLLVTLDIMDVYSDTKIPSNVSKAVNYYQTKDMYGGEEVKRTSDNKTTKVVNVLAPNSDHKSIDNDLHKKVTEVVKRELIPEKK